MGQVQDRTHIIHQSSPGESDVSASSSAGSVQSDRTVQSNRDIQSDHTSHPGHSSQDMQVSSEGDTGSSETTISDVFQDLTSGNSGPLDRSYEHDSSHDRSHDAHSHGSHDHSHDHSHGDGHDHSHGHTSGGSVGGDHGHSSTVSGGHGSHDIFYPPIHPEYGGAMIPPMPPAYESEGVDHPIMYDDRGQHRDPRFHDRPDLLEPPEPDRDRSILGGLLTLEHPHDGDRYREDCPRHRHSHGPGWHHGDFHHVRHTHMHGHC